MTDRTNLLHKPCHMRVKKQSERIKLLHKPCNSCTMFQLLEREPIFSFSLLSPSISIYLPQHVIFTFSLFKTIKPRTYPRNSFRFFISHSLILTSPSFRFLPIPLYRKYTQTFNKKMRTSSQTDMEIKFKNVKFIELRLKISPGEMNHAFILKFGLVIQSYIFF